MSYSQFTTFFNYYRVLWFAIWSNRCILDFSYNAHRQLIDNLTKYHMFAIKPVTFCASDKKLATIGIGTWVGHWKNARLVMPHNKIFVIEFISINGNATCTIFLLIITNFNLYHHEITSLYHKVLYDTMKRTPLISSWLLESLHFSSAHLTKILSCFRNYVSV